MTDTVAIAGFRSVHLIAPARVIGKPEDAGDDFTAAMIDDIRRYHRLDSATIVGRFAQAEIPNRNGHSFSLEHLVKRHRTAVHAPLNMVHHRDQIVGTVVATEMKYPIGATEGGAAQAALADGQLTAPWVDTGSLFWRRAQPEYWAATARAAQNRLLFHCVDEETELLTADGWKTHDQVSAGDVILTLNTDTGLSEWSPVRKMNRYDVDTDMIRMKGHAHSSLTTPGHRWWVKKAGTAWRRDVWEWKESRELNTQHQIPTAIPHAEFPAEPKWSDDLVDLVAWAWTEGSFAGKRIVIYQSHEVNAQNCARIRRSLTNLYGPPAKVRDGGLWYESDPPSNGITNFHLSSAIGPDLQQHCPNRVPTGEFLRSLTESQLRMFIETSLDADGHQASADGQVTFVQKDPAAAGAMQFACALAGIPTTLRRVHESAGDAWRVCLVRRSPMTNPHANASTKRGAIVDTVRYRGTVWCPTTANGTFLARRDGTCWWTGNSMEAIGESVTCTTDGCCGKTFPFRGVTSPTYCESMQTIGNGVNINHPYFVGNALILPPAQPGWRHADIKLIAAQVQRHLDEAELVYEMIAACRGELAPHQWEQLMAQVISHVYEGEPEPKVLTASVMPTPADEMASEVIGFAADFGPNLHVAADELGVPFLSAGPSDGVIVCVEMPPAVADQLVAAGASTPVDEMHVTLAFLGTVEDGQVIPPTEDDGEEAGEPSPLGRLEMLVGAFATLCEPLQAKIAGLGRWPEGDGGDECVVALVDVPGLNDLVAHLHEALDDAGITVSDMHGFTAHCTLHVGPPGTGPTEVPVIEFPIDNLAVWAGGDHVAFPIGINDPVE